jgi:hypothetical protein
MNREEFFAKLAGLDEDRISKTLWNLYWRGAAQVRQRIASELDPAEDAARKRAAAEPPDPDWSPSNSAIATSWETAPGRPAATQSRCADRVASTSASSSSSAEA